MKESILVFGGGELQISIIKKAKSLGFYVIVIDPNPNAKAINIADEFFEVGGLDFIRTLQIARENNVKGLITAATDHPILMMCKIAKELGLPFPEYESCEILLDKGKFKSFLRKNSISHAIGGVYSSYIDIDLNSVSFPCIVKPLRNSGSRGVIKCNDNEMLQKSVEECLTFCKDGKFIVEEFIEGDEISVEAYVHDNKLHIVQITDKIVSSPPYNVELGHSQPSIYWNKVEEIRTILQKIIDLTKLNHCTLHPELKIKDNLITVIEIGPRLGGDYITSDLVPLSTGIDIEEIQIKLATKKTFVVNPFSRYCLVSFLSFPEKGIVVGEVSKAELKDTFHELIEFHCDLKVGMMIGPITNSLNRYGHFILQCDNSEEMIRISKLVEQYIYARILNKN